MTHIDNIPHIIQHGITHSTSNNANSNFIAIGDNGLISTRSTKLLANGKSLGDYIPFYFGIRMPMLYVIQNGYNDTTQINACDIVYCITSIQQILDNQLEFIFTDGHAVNNFSAQYAQIDLANIEDIIDWNAIKAKYWNDENDLDLKRRKEAEFLVLGDIPNNAILGYAVVNENAKYKLVNYGVADSQIIIKPEWYF